MNRSALFFSVRGHFVEHTGVSIVLDDDDVTEAAFVRLLFLPEKAVES